MWKGLSSASFFHVQIFKQIQIAFSAHGIADGLPGAIAAAAAAAVVVVPKANVTMTTTLS
jgi:phosphoribosylcarboxyaminoimidazole (NCAIR) mutase